jgi:hypothetical protein
LNWFRQVQFEVRFKVQQKRSLNWTKPDFDKSTRTLMTSPISHSDVPGRVGPGQVTNGSEKSATLTHCLGWGWAGLGSGQVWVETWVALMGGTQVHSQHFWPTKCHIRHQVWVLLCLDQLWPFPGPFVALDLRIYHTLAIFCAIFCRYICVTGCDIHSNY